MKGITYFPGNQPSRKRGTFGGTFCITVGTNGYFRTFVLASNVSNTDRIR